MSCAKSGHAAALNHPEHFRGDRQRHRLLRILKRRRLKSDGYVPCLDLELARWAKKKEGTFSHHSRGLKCKRLDQVCIQPQNFVSFRIQPDPSLALKIETKIHADPKRTGRLQP